MAEVRDVVREVVAEHAAHELPLVDGLRELDDGRVIRILAGHGPRREPLGFGFAEAAALVTPVVWLVLDQAARRGVDAAADGLLEKGRTLLRRALRREEVPQPRELPELDRDQLTLVRTSILERAAGQGIGTRQAEALADGVVARLATAGASETGGPSEAGGPSETGPGTSGLPAAHG
ncbi:MAG TPA: hypothetical protein VNS49_24775 [Streptomyces sp.]|nr:hypothetical protein [Streptomyces sp.]